MILSRGDLKDCAALCSMCNAEPPIMAFFHIAEHGGDILLCPACATKLELMIDKDKNEYAKLLVTEAIGAVDALIDLKLEDLMNDWKARKKDIDDKY